MNPERIDKNIVFAAALAAQEKLLQTLRKLTPSPIVLPQIERVKNSIAKLKSFSTAPVSSSATEGAVVVYHDDKDDLIHYGFVLNESECQFFLLKNEKKIFWFMGSHFLEQKNAGERFEYEGSKPGDGAPMNVRKVLDVY